VELKLMEGGLACTSTSAMFTHAHSPRSLPLSHFEDAPQDEPPPELQQQTQQQQPHPEDALDEDDIPYPEPSSEQTILPPPNFRPFFALIEDATSGEHFHPHVHYVFADDDPILVTAASMRSLGLDDTKFLPHDDPEPEDQGPRDLDDDVSERDVPVESPLPPPIPGVREHYLMLDVGADGRSIVDAQSLSSEWQITNASVRTAPSFDESEPDQGFMLRIEGIEIPGKRKGKAKGQSGDALLNDARERSQGDIFGALDGLLERIEGALNIAGKIADMGPGQREDAAVDAGPQEEQRDSTGGALPSAV
jgi:hypothetical protein